MTTKNAFIFSWDMHGIESIIPITQYENWDTVLKKDYIYKILNNVINNKLPVDVKKASAFEKLKSLKQLRQL
jgi:hypothetical protein